MKLAVLGGGGFRVPQVYRALLGDSLIDEVTLYDPAPGRLQVGPRSEHPHPVRSKGPYVGDLDSAGIEQPDSRFGSQRLRCPGGHSSHDESAE